MEDDLGKLIQNVLDSSEELGKTSYKELGETSYKDRIIGIHDKPHHHGSEYTYLEEKIQQTPELPDEFYQKGIVEASQREGVVASKENTRFIGTSGVYDCVGIIGYSEETGLGFVAHYDSLTDKDFKEMLNNPYYDPLPVSLGSLPYFLEEGDKSNREVTYEVRIFTTPRGDKELLEKIVSYINYMNEWFGRIKFEIEEVDTNSNGNLLLDLETGEYYSYVPLKVPREEMDKTDKEISLQTPSKLRWNVLYDLK